MVFNRDEGVAKVRRNFRQRHIAPMLVEPEPSASVGGEEPGIADAAPKFVDQIGLSQRPGNADCRHDNQGDKDRPENAVAPPVVMFLVGGGSRTAACDVRSSHNDRAT